MKSSQTTKFSLVLAAVVSCIAVTSAKPGAFGGDRQVDVPRTGRESLVAIGDVNQQFHREPLVFVNAKMVVGQDFPRVTTKRFTCYDVCVYGEMDFLEGSTWYWNDWRDVEFREDHTFYARRQL